MINTVVGRIIATEDCDHVLAWLHSHLMDTALPVGQCALGLTRGEHPVESRHMGHRATAQQAVPIAAAAKAQVQRPLPARLGPQIQALL